MVKKLFIVALATLLTVALVLPASALENVFGGYWRTRFVTQQNFNGEDGIPAGDYKTTYEINQSTGNVEPKTELNQKKIGDLEQVDSRVRLYYTAILNDNLKLVTKFELDSVWGDNTTYGDIGADGLNVEVKNAYADFNLGPVNAKIGSQGVVLNRGFLFDDDFAGAHLTVPAGPASVSFLWIKAYEGGTNNNIADSDMYVVKSTFAFDALSITPLVAYARSNDVSPYVAQLGQDALPADTTVDMWFLSLDVDFTTDSFGVWFTGIIQCGDYEIENQSDIDYKGWLIAAGASVNLGMLDIHGQSFYASGSDSDQAANNDVDQFYVPQGQSYYWSEIMGYGIFDEQASIGSPADQISNIWAINLGTKVSLNDQLSIKGDVWYAQHVEDIKKMSQLTEDVDKLGTEIDIVVTYELIENLKLDLVGAYLFAGDATSVDGTNDEDPYEVGARLSLSF